MATTVFLDFETAVCLRDPLEAGAGGTVGRVRASTAWEAARARTAVLTHDVDPAFPACVAALAGAGASVVVVSDGAGRAAEDVCAGLPVVVYANRVDATTGELGFPHARLSCACSTCGVCKQALIKKARHAGAETVLVSGRASDHKAALLASRVLARGGLAEWCDEASVEHVVFHTLADVAAAVRA